MYKHKYEGTHSVPEVVLSFDPGTSGLTQLNLLTARQPPSVWIIADDPVLVHVIKLSPQKTFSYVFESYLPL